MGASSSHHSGGGGMTATEARKRLPVPSLQLFTRGFNRMCAATPQSQQNRRVGRTLFRKHVLADFIDMPPALADRLFEVMAQQPSDNINSTIGLDDLLRGVCVLAYGTAEERLSLLFSIYDTNSTGMLNSDQLEEFVQVINGGEDTHVVVDEEGEWLSWELLDVLFQVNEAAASTTVQEDAKQHVAINVGTFVKHAMNYSDASLVSWLFLLGSRLVQQGHNVCDHDESNTERISVEKFNQTPPPLAPPHVSPPNTVLASDEPPPPLPPKQPLMMLPSFAEARAVLEVSKPFSIFTQATGDEWFAVSAIWMNSWLVYTGCPRELVIGTEIKLETQPNVQQKQQSGWFSSVSTSSLTNGTASLANKVDGMVPRSTTLNKSNGERPSIIKNSYLVHTQRNSTTLVKSAKLMVDYFLLCPAVWSLLESWYNFDAIIPGVVAHGTTVECRVEFFPMLLTVSLFKPMDGPEHENEDDDVLSYASASSSSTKPSWDDSSVGSGDIQVKQKLLHSGLSLGEGVQVRVCSNTTIHQLLDLCAVALAEQLSGDKNNNSTSPADELSQLRLWCLEATVGNNDFDNDDNQIDNNDIFNEYCQDQDQPGAHLRLLADMNEKVTDCLLFHTQVSPHIQPLVLESKRPDDQPSGWVWPMDDVLVRSNDQFNNNIGDVSDQKCGNESPENENDENKRCASNIEKGRVIESCENEKCVQHPRYFFTPRGSRKAVTLIRGGSPTENSGTALTAASPTAWWSGTNRTGGDAEAGLSARSQRSYSSRIIIGIDVENSENESNNQDNRRSMQSQPRTSQLKRTNDDGSAAKLLSSTSRNRLSKAKSDLMRTQPLQVSVTLGDEKERSHRRSEDPTGSRVLSRMDQPGLLGLNNLGNTCFLNSAVQCLAHTPVFVDYFTNGSFLGDINVNEKSVKVDAIRGKKKKKAAGKEKKKIQEKQKQKNESIKKIVEQEEKGEEEGAEENIEKKNDSGTGGKVALAFGAVMEQMWKQKLDTNKNKKNNNNKSRDHHVSNSGDVNSSPSIPESDVAAILDEKVSTLDVDTPTSDVAPPSAASHLWPSPKITSGSLSPDQLKRELGAYDNRFAGFQQHDAHELLSTLLGALAEDLNRVKTKPYVELADSDGRPDRVVANEWWQNHTQREMSIITALFTGQFKSQIRCTLCPAVSARFEPFVYLSLSLPATSMRVVYVTLVSADAACVPMLVALNLKEGGTLADIKSALVRLQPALRQEPINETGNGSIDDTLDISDLFEPIPLIPTHEHQSMTKNNSKTKQKDTPRVTPRLLLEGDLVVTHVFNRYIYSILPDSKLISTLRASDPLYIFQLPIQTGKKTVPAAPKRAQLQFMPFFGFQPLPRTPWRGKKRATPPPAGAPRSTPITSSEHSRSPVDGSNRRMISSHLNQQLKRKFDVAAANNASHPLAPGTLVVVLSKARKAPTEKLTPERLKKSGAVHGILLGKLSASARQDVCVVVAVTQRVDVDKKDRVIDVGEKKDRETEIKDRVNSARSGKSTKSSKSVAPYSEMESRLFDKRQTAASASATDDSNNNNTAAELLVTVGTASSTGDDINDNAGNGDDDSSTHRNRIAEMVGSGDELIDDVEDIEIDSLTTSTATTAVSTTNDDVPVVIVGKKEVRPHLSYTYELRHVNTAMQVEGGDENVQVPQEKVMVVGTGGPVHVSVLQRHWFRSSCFFLNPYRSALVDVPFMLRIVPEALTGLDLYELVTKQLGLPLPKSKKKSGKAKKAPVTVDVHKNKKGNKEVIKMDSEEDGGGIVVQTPEEQLQDEEEQEEAEQQFHVTHPRYKRRWGFELRIVNQSGAACGSCTWVRSCSGCRINDDNTPLVNTWIESDCTITVDWGVSKSDKEILRQAQDLTVKEYHPSVQAAQDMLNRPYPLRSCLENFAQPVDLQGLDQVYCGGCKTHTDHKQTMEMWRNPLVLVVHLKRFQHVGGGSRKLNNLIEFPVNGLDLKAYSAAQSLVATVESRNSDGTSNSTNGTNSHISVDDKKKDERPVQDSHDYSRSLGIQVDKDGSGQHELYDLYSVVNHAGTLAGGHYYSYVKHQEEDKWFCFDDSKVSPMPIDQVVSNNAYLLFYVRRDAPSADVFPSTPLSQEEYRMKVQELEAQIHPTSRREMAGGGWRKKCTVM